MPDPYVHVPGARLEPETVVPVDPDDEHHLRRVLRLRDGDPLTVSDGRGAEAGAVAAPGGVRVLTEPRHRDRPAPTVHVLQALAKGRKVDEVVRALTELGVDAVTVVATRRTVVELRGDKASRAHERWTAVARAAAGQARRPWLPRVDGPVDLRAWLDEGAPRTGVVAHVGATTSLAQAFATLDRGAPELVLAVGPEGGFTDEEVRALAARGLQAASLGPAVVRTEHAATVLAAVTSYVLGRMS